MQSEIIVSGFGGQGALFAGQLLAYAGMDAGYHVTWIPSYGPEMRGGTAHCTTIISDDEIGSPLVRHPSAAIVMNAPSLDKYEPLIAPGGVLVVNTSLTARKPTRADITIVEVPANAIAEELGSAKLANMVLVGALLAAANFLSVEALEAALEAHLPPRHRKLIEANRQALRRGASIAATVRQRGVETLVMT
ncbi:MAG: 2-oxoacid:ferredoxin oxidoreductase subunit gamma [Chloroflexi bacterium]|nr:2-oxoacid:ferredoxin oxidoreductase subunit gamma [Chloroflexota bacterium]